MFCLHFHVDCKLARVAEEQIPSFWADKMEITQVAEYLVVDSGGFIKNAPLHQYGEQLITMYDVIDEIKDKPTKQRLLAMPFELTYKTPDSTSIQKGN